MWLTLGLFLLGLVLLVAGAEALVRGAARLAAAAGMSSLVIGLTVVAFGTSAPELAVSVGASLANQADLALGNVVGSNIFNVLLILGVSACITPLIVHAQLLRADLWIMLGVSALPLLMGLDGRISRTDGLILLAGIAGYTGWSIQAGRRAAGTTLHSGEAATAGEPTHKHGALLSSLGLVVLGLALLVIGARWLVAGAVEIASALGVSEWVIGLTIVAAGTSLPEVATSVVAAVRGERDIAVGNVVGSNIFNILAVLGAAAVGNSGVRVSPEALRFDLPVMLLVAAGCLPIFYTGRRVDRWEGAVFLGAYVAYTAYLLSRSAAA